jgi:preprotein translocase subunit SecE
VTAEIKVMDIKKEQTTSTTKDLSEKKVSIGEFVGEVKDEFGKITWTSPEELRTYTKIVVVATVLLGMGIYLIDLSIQGVLNALGTVFHFIFG